MSILISVLTSRGDPAGCCQLLAGGARTQSPPGKYSTMVINLLINILTNSISTWQIFHHDHQHIVANISVGWETNFAHLTLSWKLTYKCITAKRHFKELQKQKISAHFGFSALTLFSSCNHFQYYLFQVVPWSDPWMRRKFHVMSMSRARKFSVWQESKNLTWSSPTKRSKVAIVITSIISIVIIEMIIKRHLRARVAEESWWPPHSGSPRWLWSVLPGNYDHWDLLNFFPTSA